MLEPLLLLAASVVVWAVHSLACVFFGLAVLRMFGEGPAVLEKLSGAGYLAAAFALGQAILGVLWQSMATAGAFSPTLIVVTLAVALVVGLPTVLRVAPPLHRRVASVVADARQQSIAWQAFVIITLLLIFMFGLMTLQPPAHDALAFYLAQPKLIAATGRMMPMPGYETFAVMGLGAEMHYAVLYALSTEFAARLAVFPTALASAGLLWAIGAEVGLGRRGQWVLTAMLFTSTFFTEVLWNGKTDLFGTAWGLAAVYFVMLIGRLPNRVVLPLAGLMAGFAITGRMSLIVVLVPMLGILAAWRLWTGAAGLSGTARARTVFTGGMVIGLCALVGLGALVIKNAVVFGEPLAPYLYFGDGPKFDLVLTLFSPENTRWIVMTYPLALVFGKYPLQSGNISVLWLAFLPLISLLPRSNLRRPGPLLVLTIASLTSIIVWVAVRPSVFVPRYILPPLLSLLPLCAHAAERVWSTADARWLRPAIMLALITIVLAGVVEQAPRINRARQYVGLARTGLDDDKFMMADFVNRTAADGSRLQLTMYFRSFFRPDLLQCLFNMEESQAILEAQAAAPGALWTALHEYGAGYLIFDGTSHGKLFESPPDPALAPDWLQVTTTEFSRRDITVYELTPQPGAPPPGRTCVQDQAGLWRVENRP